MYIKYVYLLSQIEETCLWEMTVQTPSMKKLFQS